MRSSSVIAHRRTRRSPSSMCSPATSRSGTVVSRSQYWLMMSTTSPSATTVHPVFDRLVSISGIVGLLADEAVKYVRQRVHLRPELPPLLGERGPCLGKRRHLARRD